MSEVRCPRCGGILDEESYSGYSGEPGPMTRQRRSGVLRVGMVTPGRRFSIIQLVRDEFQSSQRWQRMQRHIERKGRQAQALIELAVLDSERAALTYQLDQIDRRRRRVLDGLATIPGGAPCKK